MNKATVLAKIAKEIEECDICPQGKSGKPVPGEGNPNARVVFVGEAPGLQEAKAGRPFVGRSGKFLRALVKEIGLDEKDVFITNVVRYLPDRGTPSKADIIHGRTHLLPQLDGIDPKIVVLLGSIACKAVLEEPIAITKDHGKAIEKDNRKYFISFHPAAALRFEETRKEFSNDFQKLKLLIEKTLKTTDLHKNLAQS